MVIDAEPNHLWVATDNQKILKLNSITGDYEDFSQYLFSKNKQNQKNYAIKSLLYQNDDILWIGTAGLGLKAIDLKTKKTYTYSKEEGLLIM